MTHEDWAQAKRQRDTAAHMLAKAYVGGKLDTFGPELGRRFEAADALMHLIECELDGRDAE